jgi:hypothetical protein
MAFGSGLHHWRGVPMGSTQRKASIALQVMEGMSRDATRKLSRQATRARHAPCNHAPCNYVG